MPAQDLVQEVYVRAPREPERSPVEGVQVLYGKYFKLIFIHISTI